MKKIVLSLIFSISVLGSAHAQGVIPMKPGTTYNSIGDTTFGSDGTTYNSIGNSTFGSDGSTSTTIGNSTFGSDGTTCTGIGTSVFCN